MHSSHHILLVAPLSMEMDKFLDNGLVDNMAILVGEVGTYVEDIPQAGMAGEDRQWAVVGEDKEMVDTQRNWPVELDMKEMEMKGRK